MYLINDEEKEFTELFKRKWKPLIKKENIMLGICEIQPGDKTPSHEHEDSEEIIYVLEGEGKVYLNNGEESFHSDQIIVISKNEEHSFEAIRDKKLKLICIFPLPLKNN